MQAVKQSLQAGVSRQPLLQIFAVLKDNTRYPLFIRREFDGAAWLASGAAKLLGVVCLEIETISPTDIQNALSWIDRIALRLEQSAPPLDPDSVDIPEADIMDALDLLLRLQWQIAAEATK
jgi:hypothetical protein